MASPTSQVTKMFNVQCHLLAYDYNVNTFHNSNVAFPCRFGHPSSPADVGNLWQNSSFLSRNQQKTIATCSTFTSFKHALYFFLLPIINSNMRHHFEAEKKIPYLSMPQDMTWTLKDNTRIAQFISHSRQSNFKNDWEQKRTTTKEEENIVCILLMIVVKYNFFSPLDQLKMERNSIIESYWASSIEINDFSLVLWLLLRLTIFYFPFHFPFVFHHHHHHMLQPPHWIPNTLIFWMWNISQIWLDYVVFIPRTAHHLIISNTILILTWTKNEINKTTHFSLSIGWSNHRLIARKLDYEIWWGIIETRKRI